MEVSSRDPRTPPVGPIGPSGFTAGNWIGLFLAFLLFAAAAAALLRERPSCRSAPRDGGLAGNDHAA